jgi:hypothetical protein
MNDLSKQYESKLQKYSPTAALETISENAEITINEFIEHVVKNQPLQEALGNITLQKLAKAVRAQKKTNKEQTSNLDETILNLLNERNVEELSVAEVQQNIDPEIPQATIRNALKKLVQHKRVVETGNVKNRKYSIAQSNE